ncbi:MAG: efflux RND transporter periplasmic adaptor subunit [Burkholderiales bacterium]|nr:efflux RND transporter periplasmic adaptor subunit [Burkholderiales bacterium]
MQIAIPKSVFASILRFLFRTKIIVPLLVLLGVIGSIVFLQGKAEESKGERYRSITVDRGPVIQRITANGTLNPVTVVSVGTQVSGTVTKLYTDFNNTVKANQVLLELDPALIKANLAQFDASLRAAEATARLAESTLKRNQDLVTKGFISSQTLEQNAKELDVANATVAQVKSQLDREKTNLSYTIIRSPIDGIVIDRKIDVGQTVAASFSTPTLFQIAKNLEEMQIDTSVAEADVGSVRQGMPVRFTVDAYPERDFQGKIRLVRLNPTIQQNVVTYNVVVDVNNEGSLLKPGMTAQVSFVANQREDVVRIPNGALRFKPPKDEKDDKKNPKKDLSKKKAAETAANVTPADAPKEVVKADAAAGTDASGRVRRPPARVYKVNEKNELVPIEIRTGIASNQFTEMLSGDVKPGDELVIRDLQDKTAKK